MTSTTFRSPHCGAESAVGGRSAAMRRANTAGGTFPKLLCGRSSLYFFFHATIFRRASHKFPNQLAFKHSSRNFPWKLSTCAFCTGFPGSICTTSIFFSSAHAKKCRLVNSGPLSERIASGTPRSATIVSSTRVIRGPGNPVSTSSAKHSRVYTSITLNTRNFLPLSAASCTKSIAHSWFAPVTAGLTKPARSKRFRLLRRISNPASRYTRYTRLWFTRIPFASSFNRNLRYPHFGSSRAASTKLVRNSSSFRRLTYRQLDSATPISSQIRRWLTRKWLHSQRTASALPPCALRAPPVFFNHRFQHLLVQAQIRHQLLQPPVFILQLPQPLRLAHTHPAILRFPRIHRVLRHAQLPPHLRCRPPRLHLLQRPNHLHFAILPLRHAPSFHHLRFSHIPVRGKWGEGQFFE